MAENYGANKFSQFLYGGRTNPSFVSATAVIIEQYDNTGTYKAAYQSGVGDFLGCNFVLSESGPRSFTLIFALSQEILKKDIIKIRLFNSDDYFFTGVVRELPIDGSTKQEYNYTGFGFTDYLARINSESISYSNKTVSFIIEDLLDTVIVPKTPIVKNAGKIDSVTTNIVSMELHYAQISDALDSLKKIAQADGNTYITGVDEVGEFFFKQKSTETKITLTVGKQGRFGIDTYEPHEINEPRTKYYLLDKDGVFITSVSSGEDNDIFEEKLTAPDIDDTTATAWANGILQETETEKKEASVTWKIEEADPLLLKADGKVRIISNIPALTTTTPSPNPYGSGTYGSGLYGGGQYTGKDLDDTLDVKEVSYTLRGNQSVRNINLGSLPIRLDEQINNIRKSLVDLKISLGR